MSRGATATVKGPGLARGPVLIVGVILAGFGLALFLHSGDTPTAGYPNADVHSTSLLGFESNGWTAWITTAAGALLLLGRPSTCWPRRSASSSASCWPRAR